MSENETETPEMADERDEDDGMLGVDETLEELPGTEEAFAEEGQGGSGTGIIDFVNNGGIKGMLLEETFQDPQTGHSYGQAHLVADVVNVMRMDTKQMAALHGIEVEVNKMAPERAAELLEDVAKNDGVGIIEVFQQIEDQRDLILKEKMSEEQHEQYMEFKEQMLYSVDTGGSA